MFAQTLFRPAKPASDSGDDISRYAWAFQALKAGLFCAALLAPAAVHADTREFDTPSKQALPRWAMLSKSEVYARTGPSKDNAISWIYHAQSLPVQIISETKDWRLVCDPDGGVAWISKSMLRNPKTVLSPGTEKIDMRSGPDGGASIRAVLKARSLASLDRCTKKGWCKVSAGGQDGWVPQNALWGTQDKAVCQRPNPLAVAGR